MGDEETSRVGHVMETAARRRSSTSGVPLNTEDPAIRVISTPSDSERNEANQRASKLEQRRSKFKELERRRLSKTAGTSSAARSRPADADRDAAVVLPRPPPPQQQPAVASPPPPPVAGDGDVAPLPATHRPLPPTTAEEARQRRSQRQKSAQSRERRRSTLEAERARRSVDAALVDLRHSDETETCNLCAAVAAKGTQPKLGARPPPSEPAGESCTDNCAVM